MMPSTINPDLYACLPPNKKEEYKALFPEPAKVRYPVRIPAGWALCDDEFLIIPGQDNECLVMKVDDVKQVLAIDRG